MICWQRSRVALHGPRGTGGVQRRIHRLTHLMRKTKILGFAQDAAPANVYLFIVTYGIFDRLFTNIWCDDCNCIIQYFEPYLNWSALINEVFYVTIYQVHFYCLFIRQMLNSTSSVTRQLPEATGKMRTCGSADFLDLKMTKPNYKPNTGPISNLNANPNTKQTLILM